MGWYEKEIGEEGEEGLDENEERQRKIFIATFAMLAKLTSADGSVSKSEIESIEKFIKNVLKLDEGRRGFAVKVFNQARSSKKSFHDFAEEYRQLLADEPKMLDWMLQVLMRVALADKNVSDTEVDLLRDACEVFGLPTERVDRFHKRYTDDDALAIHYETLSLSTEASREEVDKRYQELAEEFNPKRVLDAGLPEEFVALAEQKFLAVEEAYKAICEGNKQ